MPGFGCDLNWSAQHLVCNPYPGKLGVIEPGAYADLLVLNRNPLEDIHALENPEVNLAVIMKNGTVYKNML